MRKLSLAAAFLIFCSCQTATRPNRMPADYSNNLAANFPVSKTLNFEKFRTIVLRNSSIETVLAEVAALYPEYLNFYTLVYGSLSLHESTHKDPRAIVFGPTAKFIVTFNGSYDQQGGDAFEVVQFNTDSKSFEFREIKFKSLGKLEDYYPLNKDEIEFGDDRVVISKPNPQKCTMCHGGRATPIMETYSLWPGFYGSDDDRLFGRSQVLRDNFGDEPGSQVQNFRSIALDQDTEWSGYRSFLRNKQDKHPRYRFLPGFPIDNFVLSGSSNHIPKSIWDEAKKFDDRFGTFDLKLRPNLYLLKALHSLNQDRIIAALSNHKLQGVFASRMDSFAQLRNIRPYFEMEATASAIQHILSAYSFKNSPKRSFEQIKVRIKQLVDDTMGSRYNNEVDHKNNFPAGTLVSQGYADDYYPNNSATEFKAMRLSSYFRPIDPVAIVLGFVLEDNGFSLEDFNLSLHRANHEYFDGDTRLDKVAEFLGLSKGS